MWTLTLVRAAAIWPIYSNTAKWVLGLMTAEVFEKPYFGVWRIWKFHVLLENKTCVCALKSSVTHNGNHHVWSSIVCWIAGILRLQDRKLKSAQTTFQRNTLIQRACDCAKAPYFRAFQDLCLSFHDLIVNWTYFMLSQCNRIVMKLTT